MGLGVTALFGTLDVNAACTACYILVYYYRVNLQGGVSLRVPSVCYGSFLRFVTPHPHFSQNSTVQFNKMVLNSV